jgi:hypothetical protein
MKSGHPPIHSFPHSTATRYTAASSLSIAENMFSEPPLIICGVCYKPMSRIPEVPEPGERATYGTSEREAPVPTYATKQDAPCQTKGDVVPMTDHWHICYAPTRQDRNRKLHRTLGCVRRMFGAVACSPLPTRTKLGRCPGQDPTA